MSETRINPDGTTWEPPNPFTRTYTSFSGVNMYPEINGIRVGEMQGISYCINYKPKWWKFKKREIIGHITFVIFDREALRTYLGHYPQYLGEVPAFDIKVTGSNETELFSTLEILGCKILSEYEKISVDDLVNTNSFTFIAKDIIPWTPRNP